MSVSRSSPPPNRGTLSVRLGQALRRYFVTGLATLLPVVVTVWLVWQIFKLADGFLGDRLGLPIPGLGLVVTVLVVLVVGVISIHFGRVAFRTLEAAFLHLPLTNEGQSSATGKPSHLLTLLVPSPPSPFSGPIIFVPQEEVIPLALSIEDALKLVVSGGVVAMPLQAEASSKP
jgi:uncharacterized membrane protein